MSEEQVALALLSRMSPHAESQVDLLVAMLDQVDRVLGRDRAPVSPTQAVAAAAFVEKTKALGRGSV
jgi:hypothetical protein